MRSDAFICKILYSWTIYYMSKSDFWHFWEIINLSHFHFVIYQLLKNCYNFVIFHNIFNKNVHFVQLDWENLNLIYETITLFIKLKFIIWQDEKNAVSIIANVNNCFVFPTEIPERKYVFRIYFNCYNETESLWNNTVRVAHKFH